MSVQESVGECGWKFKGECRRLAEYDGVPCETVKSVMITRDLRMCSKRNPHVLSLSNNRVVGTVAGQRVQNSC
jgi:hypothetical protein